MHVHFFLSIVLSFALFTTPSFASSHARSPFSHHGPRRPAPIDPSDSLALLGSAQRASVARAFILHPALDLEVDVWSYQTLHPNKTHRLYYESKNDAKTRKAWASFVFSHPAVALDHSAYVDNVTCTHSGTAMIVHFSTEKALHIAQSWSKDLPIILTGHGFAGCEPKEDYDHAHTARFWAIVESVKPHDGGLQLVFPIKMVGPHEIAQDLELNIGHPNGSGPRPPPPSSGAPTPSSGSHPGHGDNGNHDQHHDGSYGQYDGSHGEHSTGGEYGTGGGHGKGGEYGGGGDSGGSGKHGGGGDSGNYGHPGGPGSSRPSSTQGPSSGGTAKSSPADKPTPPAGNLPPSGPQQSQPPWAPLGNGGSGSSGSSSLPTPPSSPGGSSPSSSTSPSNPSPPPSVPTFSADPINEDFDVALDEKIGYFTVFDQDFIESVFPGIQLEIDLNGDSPSRRKHHSLSLSAAFQSAVSAVTTVVKAAVKTTQAAVNVAATVVNSAKNIAAAVKTGKFSNIASATAKASVAIGRASATLVIDAIKTTAAVADLPLQIAAAVLPSISITPLNTDWQMVLPPASLLPTTESVFGDGFKMFDYNKTVGPNETVSITAFCVQCQLQGDMEVVGTMRYTFPGILTAATLTLSGPMELHVEIGLLMKDQLKLSFEHEYQPIPLVPAIAIPGIVTIGPTFEMKSEVAFTYEVDGYIGLGFNVTWDKSFSLTIDLVSPVNSNGTGLYPTSFTPFVNIGEAMTMTAEASMTFGLPLALDFFPLLTNKLSLEAGPWFKESLQATLTDGFELPLRRRDVPTIDAAPSNTSSSDIVPLAHRDFNCQGLSIGLQNVKQGFVSAEHLSASWAFYTTTSTIAGWCDTAAPTPSPTATNSTTSTTTTSSSPTPTPTNQYRSPVDNSTYQIYYNLDFFGSDMISYVGVPSVQACIDKCSQYNLAIPSYETPCGSVSFVPYRYADGQPSCYIKPAGVTPTTQVFEVDSAILLTKGIPARRSEGSDPDPSWSRSRRRAQKRDGTDSVTPTPTPTDNSGQPTSLYTLTIPTETGSPTYTYDPSTFDVLVGLQDLTDQNLVPTNLSLADPYDASPPNSTVDATNTTTVTSDYDGPVAEIESLDGLLYAFVSDNGNIFLQTIATSSDPASQKKKRDGLDTSGFFLASTPADDDPAGPEPIWGDYTGRLLHVYSDELAAYGVSRIRLGGEDTFPLTSIAVTLVPLTTLGADTNGDTLVALTTAGDLYYLAACVYTANPALAKLFVIENYPDGLAILESVDVETTLTGAPIKECVLIGLKVAS
ncbi:hypothetical protein JAAARDRAFT_38640 [Jaapia argillacea MUCL 33604]|uniref:Apple domain-containing protein n=1 Tax=Jaapia argillacea MUCL 33604 TaxID=933084 RepID=A0A067PGY6_9AGAM|nr:hypothetical protein JAAARDRAFT_38640 [Jaapia argillacea MUCL 33604]